jgi:putative FmdB family regulatory protein
MVQFSPDPRRWNAPEVFMPIYEYQCSKCGHEIEVIQKMADDPLKECPECHQDTVCKLVSAAGFQLKGTGWYVTDYSSKGKAKVKDASSGKTETDSSTTSSTDKSSNDGGTAS